MRTLFPIALLNVVREVASMVPALHAKKPPMWVQLVVVLLEGSACLLMAPVAICQGWLAGSDLLPYETICPWPKDFRAAASFPP